MFLELISSAKLISVFFSYRNVLELINDLHLLSFPPRWEVHVEGRVGTEAANSRGPDGKTLTSDSGSAQKHVSKN